MSTGFGDKIRKIIKDAGYSYKARVYPAKETIRKNGKKIVQDYDKVVVYAGRSIEKLAQKRSRRLVAWKEDGEWQGDMEVVREQGGKGERIYILDYHDKTEPLTYTIFSDLDWDDNEEYAKQRLLRVLEKWRFVEQEREKLEDE